MTKLLIVENDDHLNCWLRDMFASGGFDTHGTWSGQEALRLLASGEFDTVLVDEHLPDIYVGEFLERIARLPIQPRVVLMHPRSPKHQGLRHYQSSGICVVVDKSDPIKVRAAVCCAGDPMVDVN
jgi:CheY-like chemotaxis protein